MTANLTTIRFHGASLIAKKGDTPETTLVAMKPLVEGMELDWKSQHAKITGHPILGKGMVEITMPSEGGPQAMTALPLNRIHFWLATIHPNKIRNAAIREKVIIYQTEVADTLFEKFFGRAIATKEAASGRQVAAIIEDKLAAFISRTLPNAVAGYIAEHNLSIADGVTAGEVCGLSRIAGSYPRGIAGRVSKRMGAFCAARNVPVPVTRLGKVRAQLFPTHLAREWLDLEGRSLIKMWLEEKKGQTVLRLVSPPEPSKLTSIILGGVGRQQ